MPGRTQQPSNKLSKAPDEPICLLMPLLERSSVKWKLPPLILHPFADSTSPTKIIESSKASLMLQGLIPSEETTAQDLERKLLAGRHCEIRMLYYVGKDVSRWLEQCCDFAARHPELREGGIRSQSFAGLLVDDPPEMVREKLRRWGVADYRKIFSRGLGLNAVFAEVPQLGQVTDDFTRNYHQYADQMYLCSQGARAFRRIQSDEFDFDLFASGEYSRMLEREWQSTESQGD